MNKNSNFIGMKRMLKNLAIGIGLLVTCAWFYDVVGSWTPVNGKQRFNYGLGLPVKTLSSVTGYDSSQIWLQPGDSSVRYAYKGVVQTLTVNGVTVPRFLDTMTNVQERIQSKVDFTSSYYIGTTANIFSRASGAQTLTGVGIDGNAGTVTNGVYTSGSYANPSWITSLPWSKITGTPTTIAGYGITDAVSTSSTFYLGTTSIALNRSSASQSLTGISVDGNAGTATVLLNARTINGTSFNGSANITITAAAGTLTGITLNSTVVSSSLTGVGTITTGVWQATSISTTYTDAKLKTVTGTTNRITIGGTSTDPTFDISTSYVGQSTITTLGTITTGVWNGTAISDTYISSASTWNTAYSERRQWDGGATNLVAATGRTSLGATTVGSNLFTLTNPSAITFPRFNADNTVSALDAATFRTAIGAGTSSTSGTVTSVSLTTPTGLTTSGSPITTSGTFAITFTSGYSIPTDANQTNWTTAYSNRITSLTVTGSSGAATLLSNVLNIPTYTFNGLSPMTTAGDIIYGGASGIGTRLAAGTSTQVLHGGTTPSWGAVVSADITSLVWSKITSTPTTLSGYGITDAASSTATFTLGSTSIALGSTTTTVAGLASVTSTSFVGALTGNATTSTTTSYLAQTGSGTNANTIFQANPAADRSWLEVNGGTNMPSSDWWFLDNMRHTNGSNYWGTQIAYGWEANAGRIAIRNVSAGTYGSWIEILTSSNYNSYSPTLTGTGASGTWAINITGNSATTTLSANSTAWANQTYSGSHGTAPLQFMTNTTGSVWDYTSVANVKTALNLSGTNTGDQTITLTGNVTGSGTGSFATTIAAGAVTNSMLAGSIAASKLVGTDITTIGTLSAGAVPYSLLTGTVPTWNQNTTGSAATLTTARTINGTSFNGSADITITAAAGTLTGGTLASGVTASSLTSLGTLVSLNVTGSANTGALSATTIVGNNITAKGDMIIWGGNGALAGYITSNSGGGGLYIAAQGTNQNIRLLSSGTGIVQSIGNFDVTGTINASSSITGTAASFTTGTFSGTLTAQSNITFSGYIKPSSNTGYGVKSADGTVLEEWYNGAVNIYGTSTFSSGKDVKLTAGDLYFLDNSGYGFVSANSTRVATITNAGVGIPNITGNISVAGTGLFNNTVSVTNGASARTKILLSDNNTASLILAAGNSLPGTMSSDLGLAFRVSVSYPAPDGGVLALGLAATTGAATFISTVTATSFFESSDLRYKNVITRVASDDGFDMITFTWNKDLKRDNTIHYGYGAQEVMKILPNQVIEDKSGHFSVNYTEVLVYKIAQLEKRINQLEKNNK